jgi:hypothetical protein
VAGEGSQGWISVRGWRRFQHYDPEKRQPPWIKMYTELMSDEAWITLSGHDRSVLACLWLEYASSRCRLRADTRSLTRQLNLRVTSATLERLNQAGWIDIVASKTLAEGYHPASPRAHDVEVETEVEVEPLRSPLVIAPVETVDNSVNGSRATKLEDMPL